MLSLVGTSFLTGNLLYWPWIIVSQMPLCRTMFILHFDIVSQTVFCQKWVGVTNKIATNKSKVVSRWVPQTQNYHIKRHRIIPACMYNYLITCITIWRTYKSPIQPSRDLFGNTWSLILAVEFRSIWLRRRTGLSIWFLPLESYTSSLLNGQKMWFSYTVSSISVF